MCSATQGVLLKQQLGDNRSIFKINPNRGGGEGGGKKEERTNYKDQGILGGRNFPWETMGGYYRGEPVTLFSRGGHENVNDVEQRGGECLGS